MSDLAAACRWFDGCKDLIVPTASLHRRTDVSAVIVSLDRALRPDGRICASNT
jgi:hypothetical protein